MTNFFYYGNTQGFSVEAVQSAVKEAREMPKKVAQEFSKLAAEYKVQIQEFAKAQGNWEVNAILSIELISVLENSLSIINDLNSLEHVNELYETILLCSKSQYQLLSSNTFNNQSFQRYFQLLAKLFYENINCIVVSLEKHTMKFSNYLIPFFIHYFEVLVLLPKTSNFFFGNKIKKILRFLTSVILCPFYRHQFWESIQHLAAIPKFNSAKLAYDQLNEFLNLNNLKPIVESLIKNYIILSDEELQTWQNDPESYVRENETTDTIRSFAEELLLGLFFRSPQYIKEILTRDVTHLQSLVVIFFSLPFPLIFYFLSKNPT